MGKITAYLNQLKNRAGYTQQQLSDLTGIPLGTIPKYFGAMDDDSANFEIVRKLVLAMHGSLDAINGTEAVEAIPAPSTQEKMMQQATTVAAQAATLEARNESIAHYKDQIATLQSELQSERTELQLERKRTNHMQTALVIMIVLIIILAAVYIWDVRNLHSGLTAYFNS